MNGASNVCQKKTKKNRKEHRGADCEPWGCRWLQAERMRVELKRVEEERKRAVVDARREADERRQEEARRRLDEETRLRQVRRRGGRRRLGSDR